MSDLIDRQTAIEAVKMLSCGETDPTKLAMRIVDYLKHLPELKNENRKCSNKLPCGWCSLFDAPCSLEKEV